MSLSRVTCFASFMAAAAVGSTAYATDLSSGVEYVPPPPEAWSWSGVYFGAGGGFQNDSATTDLYIDDYIFGVFSASLASAATSGFATVQGGADHQLNSLVVGVFGNYDWHPSPGSAPLTSGVFDGTVTWGDAWAVGGRLGVVVHDRVLLYGLAGYGQKHISATSSHSVDGGSAAYEGPLTASGWQGGPVVGVGIEALLRQHLSVRAEYRYARYAGLFAEDDQVGLLLGGETDYKSMMVGPTDSHTGRIVLSWRLGGPNP